MSGAGRLGIGLALLTALALVVFGVVAWADRPSPGTSVAKPQLVSMQASAQAMEQAGAVMQTHGRAMLAEGQQKGDRDLIAHGNHWTNDGQQLMLAGQWMTMNPTAPGSLIPTADIGAGNRGQLNQSIEAMLRDPSNAKEVDIAALRWVGLSMRGEGQNMVDHARVMAEEARLMIERHGLQGQAADDLRQAADTMRQTGGYLMQNGQAMVDYGDQLQRGMGFK